MRDPDHELVQRCRAGDGAAQELLYRRYVDRVWRYGWLVTRSREGAAEVVQETFLRVLRSIGEFRGKSTFATWMFAVTRSAVLAHLREQRKHHALAREAPLLRLVPAGEETPAEPTDLQMRESVREAIADLPGAQRDAIVLFELCGMSLEETRNVLGWSLTRLKSTLFRARRRLRELIGQQGHETIREQGNA
jgi:RNA polymerase sigma-70 factor (ECF subfamily)